MPKRSSKKGLKRRWTLENGSLLVMQGDVQKNFTHEIPKEAKVKEPRIVSPMNTRRIIHLIIRRIQSITFRQLVYQIKRYFMSDSSAARSKVKPKKLTESPKNLGKKYLTRVRFELTLRRNAKQVFLLVEVGLILALTHRLRPLGHRALIVVSAAMQYIHSARQQISPSAMRSSREYWSISTYRHVLFLKKCGNNRTGGEFAILLCKKISSRQFIGRKEFKYGINDDFQTLSFGIYILSISVVS